MLKRTSTISFLPTCFNNQGNYFDSCFYFKIAFNKIWEWEINNWCEIFSTVWFTNQSLFSYSFCITINPFIYKNPCFIYKLSWVYFVGTHLYPWFLENTMWSKTILNSSKSVFVFNLFRWAILYKNAWSIRGIFR